LTHSDPFSFDKILKIEDLIEIKKTKEYPEIPFILIKGNIFNKFSNIFGSLLNCQLFSFCDLF